MVRSGCCGSVVEWSGQGAVGQWLSGQVRVLWLSGQGAVGQWLSGQVRVLWLSGHGVVAQWLSGHGAGLAISTLQVQMPTNVLSSATLGKLFTHMCLCHEVV